MPNAAAQSPRPSLRQRAEAALDHWLFREYETSIESLGIYRILYALVFFAYVIPRWDWIASFPDSFFDPPMGLTIFFTGFPPAWYFQGLTALLVFAGVCLLFGYRTRAASLTIAFGLVAGCAWEYSFGKISHNIALVLVPLVMAGSGWGHAWSLDARAGRTDGRRSDAWPLALLAFLIGAAFFTAALPKALGGWLALDSQATQGQLLFNYFVMERQPFFAQLAVGMDAGWFWEMLDIGTIVLEAGFILAAVRRDLFRAWLVLALTFHVSVLFTLDIVFLSLPLAYAAFVNWEGVARSAFGRGLQGALAPLAHMSLLHLVALAAGIYTLFALWGNPAQALSLWLVDDPLKLQGMVGYAIASVAGAAFCAHLLRELRPGRLSTHK